MMTKKGYKERLYRWTLPLFVAVALGAAVYHVNGANRSVMSSSETTVYICTGKYAKTYHSTTKCRGLGNCQSSVKAVTQTSAVKAGRRACKVCW